MSDSPEYSILISTRNEGASLRHTVDDLVRNSPPGAYEIVIVDDESQDDSLDFVTTPGYSDLSIRSIRNDHRRGLIFSRAQAVDHARGRYLCFLDAHCAVSADWLIQLRECLQAIDERGIVVPVIHRLQEEEWGIDFTSHPSTACSIENPFLDFHWVEPRVLDGKLVTCTVGGMAWMCSREWYRHIGGLDREMLSWGGENIDVSLRTWVVGGTCVIAPDVAVGHRFRKESPDGIHGVELNYNKIRAAHTAFAKETFEKVLYRLGHLPGFTEALNRLQEDPGELPRIKGHIESIRQRSDRWLIDTFRLPVLEPPFFYRPGRKPTNRKEGVRNPFRRPRPTICVLVSLRGDGTRVEATLSSILQSSTYTNCEVVVSVDADVDGSSVADVRTKYSAHPRVRWVQACTSGDSTENLAACLSDADYLAVMDDGVVIRDESWIEKFVLLFERRPHLVMACPGSRVLCGSDPSDTTDVFDVLWDWETSGFSRLRQGEPLDAAPYQALACPDTLLFVRRESFVRLGGFDPILADQGGRILDFALRAWLCGFEIFCLPGVSVDLLRSPEDNEKPAPAPVPGRECSPLLPALKYFSNSERLKRCRRQSRRADVYLSAHQSHLLHGQQSFRRIARFGDDALFYKFQLDASPGEQPPARSVWIETQVSVAAMGGSRASEVLGVIERTGVNLFAHVGYEDDSETVVHFICDNPVEAALALQKSDLQAETETVVVVRTDWHPRALEHLLGVLQIYRVRVTFNYITVSGNELFAVFHTDDNCQAEDVLRAYLLPIDDECAAELL